MKCTKRMFHSMAIEIKVDGKRICEQCLQNSSGCLFYVHAADNSKIWNLFHKTRNSISTYISVDNELCVHFQKTENVFKCLYYNKHLLTYSTKYILPSILHK